MIQELYPDRPDLYYGIDINTEDNNNNNNNKSDSSHEESTHTHSNNNNNNNNSPSIALLENEASLPLRWLPRNSNKKAQVLSPFARDKLNNNNNNNIKDNNTEDNKENNQENETENSKNNKSSDGENNTYISPALLRVEKPLTPEDWTLIFTILFISMGYTSHIPPHELEKYINNNNNTNTENGNNNNNTNNNPKYSSEYLLVNLLSFTSDYYKRRILCETLHITEDEFRQLLSLFEGEKEEERFAWEE